MSPNRPDKITLAAFALIVVLGGSNFVAVRFTNFELPPFWGAAFRFSLAALIFWVAVLVGRHSLPRGRTFFGVLLYGALGFGISYAALYWSLSQIQAGVASIVTALVPLTTLFLAIAHKLEKFRRRSLLGALVAVGGIALAFGEQPSGALPLIPLLVLLAGAASIAEASVIAKLYTGIHPVVVNAISMLMGSLILILISLVAGEKWILPTLPETWFAFLYLVFFGTVAVFLLFLFVIKRWTASATSYTFVLFPFVTVLLSALLDNEPVTLSIVVGGALVVFGVWAGAIARDPKPQAKVDPASQKG